MTAMGRQGDEFVMQIDVLHALQDIVDAYDKASVMVVTEAIANAIDVGARTVSVTLDGESRSISFHNDGPPMSGRQFKDYHVIARSSKSKGSGIGFAGVGAKVYLAAWDKAVIHTETSDGRSALASDMYVDGGTPKFRHVKSRLRKRGTLYRVTLAPGDYDYLKKHATDVIAGAFSPAIDNGLRVSVNGARVAPWSADHAMQKRFSVTAKGARLQVALTVAKADLPPDLQGVQYHVSGKVIATKRPEWLANVKPPYAKRVHAYVDATRISDHLNLNKTAFKSNGTVSAAYKESGRRIFDELEKGGYARDLGTGEWKRTPLTRFFDDLFKDPAFAFLNPEARGGHGPGAGPGSGGEDEPDGPGSGGEDEPDGPGDGPGREKGGDGPGREKGGDGPGRGGGSLSLGFVNMENDAREGWLDPKTSRVVINMEHPLFIKYESVMAARSQRIATVVTTVLLKNAATKRDMGAEEALDMQSRVLTMAKDSVW